MLRITPLYGSRWSPQGQAEEPSCTLVEYAGIKILWNCGYKPDFPEELPGHDAVIISDSSLAAAGGLPQYFKHMMRRRSKESESKLQDGNELSTSNQQGWLPKIYATFPTVKMGQMTLYDLHASICLDGGQPAFSLQDIDDVFSSIYCIKYNQPVSIMVSNRPTTMGKVNRDLQSSIAVTAYRAGHLVGAAFFGVHRYLDETHVVLTTSRYQIAKELHLDGSTLLQDGASPDVLVCSPGGVAMRYLRTLAHTSANGRRATSATSSLLPTMLVTQAERNVTETIMSTLRRDGNVLMPVDAAGRVLELVLLMNRHWERHRLTGTYNLVWFAPMVHNTLDYARSQLEWMATQLGTEFDSMGTGHPYQLRALRLCTSMRQLEQILSNQNPTCVLASGLSLEAGPARDVLLKWADNPDNAVVFTDSSQCFLRSTFYGTADPDSPFDSVMAETHFSMASSAAVPATSTGTGPVTIEMEAEESAEQGAAGVGRQALIGEPVEFASKWTTAGQLLLAWAQAKLESREMEDILDIDVRVPRRLPLTGTELKSFLASEEKARQQQLKEEEASAMLREIEIAKGELRLGEQEASASVLEPTSSSNAKRARSRSRFDSNLFLKFSKPLHLMFELRDQAVGIGLDESNTKTSIGEKAGRSADVVEDDYGIAVNSELFSDIVSGVDPSRFGGSGRIGEEVLRRGLGYGVDGKGLKGQLSSIISGSKGADVVEHDDIETLDEDALEAVDLSEGKGIIRGRSGRPPAKVSAVVRKIEVQAEISFVPLEGRVDARAARQSVRALQPRRAIVLGGAAMSQDEANMVDEVANLAEAAKSFISEQSTVMAPQDGEMVELNIGHSAYAVRIIDAPFQTAENLNIGMPTPRVSEPNEFKLGACSVSLLDCVATGKKVAMDGSVVLAPDMNHIDASPSLYLSDGDVLLTDLRAELIAAGMKAEYSTHPGYAQLVVNQAIIVKKTTDSSHFQVEGPLCEDFYAVRAVVCGQFVVL